MKIKALSDWNGASRPLIIAGPCAAESREQILSTAKEIQAIDPSIIFRAGVWKPRTRPGSFQGIGTPALSWLAEVQKQTGLVVATEVANQEQVEACINAGITTLWIGARTTVNPFYVEEIAEAMRGKNVRVLVKNPIHPDINAWIGSIERFLHAGIEHIIAIHRGFHPLPGSKFRNYPNWPIPVELKQRYPTLPIITDPSHITGDKALVAKISQEALDMNMDGLMIETHINPPQALSDKEQQLTPAELRQLIENLQIHRDLNHPDHNLDQLRREIDQIDHQLLELLSKRMILSQSIGKIKKDNNLALFQPERWAQLLEARINWGSKLSLREFFTTELFKTIHSESIEIQKGERKN